MPKQPLQISLPLDVFSSFEMANFGSVNAPEGPVRFGFQLDMSPDMKMREAVFGLVQRGAGASKPIGFAVRLDLERGEIWDMVNESGLIGWVDQPLGFSVAGGAEPVLLSIEIERVGSALLPKLQIGGEEWLYPAIRSTAAIEFAAVAGAKGSHSSHLDCGEVFGKPSLWSEGAK